MLFFAIKRMNAKIGEAIFILHVPVSFGEAIFILHHVAVLFEYQMEKRIKRLCYFN